MHLTARILIFFVNVPASVYSGKGSIAPSYPLLKSTSVLGFLLVQEIF